MEEKTYASFIDKCKLRKVSSIKELQTLIDECRNNKTPLQDLDLEDLDIRDMDMGKLHIRNVLFNSFDPRDNEPKVLFNINFKGSEFDKVCFSYCSLVRCNFDRYKITKKEIAKHNHLSETANDTDSNLEIPTILNEVDFFFCRFDTCRFRNTEFNIADFRYSSFIDCSLGGCNIYVGDFYMASFYGSTNFHNSKFRSCSLTNAVFEQHCPSIFNIDKLAQENYTAYHDIIIGAKNWSKHNPCAGYSHMNEAEDHNDILGSKISNCHEAYRVYATLSGIYNGKGFFRESNQAYRLAKKNEAAYHTLSSKKYFHNHEYKKFLRHLWKRFTIGVSWAFGYGYKVPYVTMIAIILVAVFSGVFYSKSTEEGVIDSIALSLNNTLGPHEYFGKMIGLIWASLQTTLGILLVGFMGFIAANRIRNNA